MKRHRLLAGLLLGGLVLSVTLALSHALGNPEEKTARQKLDQLLAQAEPMTVPDPGLVAPPPQPVQPDVRSLFELLRTPAVDIRETPAAYEIRVPLAHAGEAENVTVDAQPHRIQVTVKSTRENFSSSTVRATTTLAELLPAEIKRETLTGADGQLTLLITVPKRNAGSPAPLPNALPPDWKEAVPQKPVTI